MAAEQRIFVVMPAYNEAAQIGGVIGRIPAMVERIIVVNDNSSDDTAEAAKGAGDGRVEVITNSENLGVGGATMAGYSQGGREGADIVVKIDGDGQMDPEAISKLVKPIIGGAADYTKGFRFHDRKTLETMPKVRLFGNLGLSYLVKMASGYWSIFDPTNGFTAIHRGTLELLELENISRDYFFETDMLCNLYRAGAVIKDVLIPVHYGDEASNLSPAKTLCQFPVKLFKAYVQRIIWNYYVKDFSTFSVLNLFGWLLFMFGVIFGAVVWFQNAYRGVVTTTGTVMVSVVPLFLGFQMILQALILDINNVPREPLQREYNGADTSEEGA